jgi:hypothetical protein
MGAMDARRLELYELLKPKLDEESARALVLALPADPDSLATKADLFATKADLESGIQSLEQRLTAKIDSQGAELQLTMEATTARLENVLTRRMITIMGAWTILIGSAFGWAAALLR